MIALYIIGGIIVFFAIIFSLSITLYVKQNEDLTVKFGVGGIKVFAVNPNEKEQSDAQKAKAKKAVEKKKDEQKPSEDDKKPKEKKSIKRILEEKLSNGEKRSVGELIELALDIMKSVLPPVGDILKHIRITSLSVKLNIGAEDADQTAYTYAAVSTGVYAVLAVLQENIVVKVKKIELNADFVSGEIREDISFKVKIRISVILYNAAKMLMGYLKNKG